MRVREFGCALAVVSAACSFDTTGLTGGDDGSLLADAEGPGAPEPDASEAPDGDTPEPDARDDAGAGCDTGQRNLPFEPTNFDGTAVPAPLACEELRIPEGETWIVDTSADVDEDERIIVGGPGDPPQRRAAPGTFEIFDPPEGPEMARVVVEDAEIANGATLRARGERPLALVSLGEIRVGDGAVISVRPDGSGEPAAGGDGRLCDADEEAGAGGEGESDSSGCGLSALRGGGGGGGFGASGGPGGGPPEDGGGDAGEPSGRPLDYLRGGCRGAEGVGSGGGSAGRGGGGVQLIAAEVIDVGEGSAVTASGRGGGGGARRHGGGGGGSGGAVLVEAPVIDIDGSLTANGGGGGEGGNDLASSGEPGSHGSVHDANRAPGGAGTTNGGNGGAGGALEEESGAGSEEDGECAGGGGGGGVGVILVRACDGGIDQFDAVISPAPTTDDLELGCEA